MYHFKDYQNILDGFDAQTAFQLLQDKSQHRLLVERITIPEIRENVILQDYIVILQKGYTPLKSRELEELPRFLVMSWQPFQLPWSASLCLFK